MNRQHSPQQVENVVNMFIGDNPAIVAIAVELVARYPRLESVLKPTLEAAINLIQCFASGHRLFICGNGGSFADALHMSGELMKSFNRNRALSGEDKKKFDDFKGGNELAEALEYGFPVTVLGANAALHSAVENDVSLPCIGYAQQLFCCGKENDVLIGISTSGNAKNVYNAMIVAKTRKMLTIGMTGKSGGALKEIVDLLISVPETETPKVQELHLPVYHAICEIVEAYNFHKPR